MGGVLTVEARWLKLENIGARD